MPSPIVKGWLWSIAIVLIAGAPSVWANEGYVGVFADSLGNEPCVTVPVGTARTLYVVAHTGDHTAQGITGSEFRIEVDNPTGWILMYAPPLTAELIGDIFDTDPDSIAGGANIVFRSCKSPSAGGTINLGTIQVFNLSGTSTELRIKRHSRPSNHNYPCPLLVACDEPTYPTYCMAEPAGSCYLKVSKTNRVASDDRSAFVTALNLPEPDMTQPQAFSDTLDLKHSELWVGAQEIVGPRVVCSYEGGVFSLGGVPIPFSEPPFEWPDAQLSHLYRDVPQIQQDLARGATIAEAVRRFDSSIDSLSARATLAFLAHGLAAAQAEFEHSPIVSHAAIEGTAVVVTYVGIDVRTRRSFAAHPFEHQNSISPLIEKPREITEWLRARLNHEPLGGAMFLVTEGGSQTMLTGSARAEARAQIEHLLRGGTIADRPAGPLGKHDGTLRAIERKLKGR